MGTRWEEGAWERGGRREHGNKVTVYVMFVPTCMIALLMYMYMYRVCTDTCKGLTKCVCCS